MTDSVRPEFETELATAKLVPLPDGHTLRADTPVYVDRVTAGRYGRERDGGRVLTSVAVGAKDFTFKVKVPGSRQLYKVDRRMCGIEVSVLASGGVEATSEASGGVDTSDETDLASPTSANQATAGAVLSSAGAVLARQATT